MNEIKTQFTTREGLYKLLPHSEYSRPNRVPFNSQGSNPVRVSFVNLNDQSGNGDRLCFNVGRELYFYIYKGVRKVPTRASPGPPAAWAEAGSRAVTAGTWFDRPGRPSRLLWSGPVTPLGRCRGRGIPENGVGAVRGAVGSRVPPGRRPGGPRPFLAGPSDSDTARERACESPEEVGRPSSG